jgi:branched-chain amino acid transport system ATP-binding protein
MILEINDLGKEFGGVVALKDVGLTVQPGEILGIIGPNGAGKTTLFNVITGFQRATRGEVFFDGRKITGLKPNRIARLGLVRTWQLVNLIPNRTALENILMAYHLERRASVVGALLNTRLSRSEESSIRARALELMESMGLTEIKNDAAYALPYGLQRLLGVCLALAANPKLLLLDEPTAGMSGSETASMIEQIQTVRGKGVTVMLVEHDMKVIMNTCDRILVLNFGVKIAEGAPAEISNNYEVIKAYLGFENTNDQSIN